MKQKRLLPPLSSPSWMVRAASSMESAQGERLIAAVGMKEHLPLEAAGEDVQQEVDEVVPRRLNNSQLLRRERFALTAWLDS